MKRCNILIILSILFCLCSCASNMRNITVVNPKTANSLNAMFHQGDPPGEFRVLQDFERVDAVILVSDINGEMKRSLLDSNDWEYDRKKCTVKISCPVSSDQNVIVHGSFAYPWRWNTRKALAKNSVRLVLKDKYAVAGKDFEVDENKGIIRVKNQELCAGSYFLKFAHASNPSETLSIGTMSPEKMKHIK